MTTIPIENDPFGPRLHYAAIEFHAKDKAVAERRRDAVLAAITAAQPQGAGK